MAQDLRGFSLLSLSLLALPLAFDFGRRVHAFSGVRIKELLHQYHGLEPTEQAAFAAMVRAHQLFNTEAWRQEIARRSRLLESKPAMPIAEIERLMKALRTET